MTSIPTPETNEQHADPGAPLTRREGEAPPADRKPRLPSRLRRPLVLLVIVLAAVGAYRGYEAWLATQPLEIGGTVEVRAVSAASRTGGRVREVPVEEGDRVHVGQALVLLDRVELEAHRDEARAAVDLAQAQLDRANNGPRAAEIAAWEARVATAQAALREITRGARPEEVDRARAQLAAAESQLDNARQASERANRLADSQTISRAELDTAATQVRVAQGNRDAAQSTLDALLHGSRSEDIAQARAHLAEATAQLENERAGSRDEEIRAMQAQLAQARARLSLAEINLAEATIVSPCDCVVEALDLRPGDMLGPNQPAVTLVEDSQMFVRAYIPETQMGLARVGQSVRFTVDTFGDHTFHARVEHVNQVGEYTPRNVQTVDERANQVFLIRLGVTDGRELLRAGMAATVHLPRVQP